MSASVNVLSAIKISTQDFVSFVNTQGGFINDVKEVSGGFGNNEAHVWFYNLEKALNDSEYNKEYLLEISNYLAETLVCCIYLELSSDENSNALMLRIAQQMSKVWPVYFDCSLHKFFTYDHIDKILTSTFKNKHLEDKMILGNHFIYYFSEDIEDKIIHFIDQNYALNLVSSFSKKRVELPIEQEDILRSVSIDNVQVYFSVVYECDSEETELMERLNTYIEDKPNYFCEVFFGYGLNVSQERSLLNLVSKFQRLTGSVGMGIFRKIIGSYEIESLINDKGFIRFA